MFSIRSVLSISGSNAESINKAIHSDADVILVDLNNDVLDGYLSNDLSSALKSIFDLNRPLLLRINVNNLTYLTDSFASVCFDYFVGLVVEGIEVPQDVRDIDVALRKYEGTLNLQPGVIILFPEISSVEGLTAIDNILDSVDRIGAMFINRKQIASDFGRKQNLSVLNEYILSRAAVETRAKRIPWVLAEYDKNIQSELISISYNADALGVVVTSEAQVPGINSLFTPSTSEVE
ncbi:MAG: aldolase/citrate lyase family protein [Dehalococcoidia bacterium]|nr:aldolase/citrate lyase family protein [Dehalococcoidia bacterium]